MSQMKTEALTRTLKLSPQVPGCLVLSDDRGSRGVDVDDVIGAKPGGPRSTFLSLRRRPNVFVDQPVAQVRRTLRIARKLRRTGQYLLPFGADNG